MNSFSFKYDILHYITKSEDKQLFVLRLDFSFVLLSCAAFYLNGGDYKACSRFDNVKNLGGAPNANLWRQ